MRSPGLGDLDERNAEAMARQDRSRLVLYLKQVGAVRVRCSMGNFRWDKRIERCRVVFEERTAHVEKGVG